MDIGTYLSAVSDEIMFTFSEKRVFGVNKTIFFDLFMSKKAVDYAKRSFFVFFVNSMVVD